MEASRGDKTICLGFDSEAHYQACTADRRAFRQHLLDLHSRHPEVFPPRFGDGFWLHGSYYSVKQQLWIRRIKLVSDEEVYQVRPSFVLPYMVGLTDEVEKALYLRRYGVPFEALAQVFGRNAMYWYRLTVSLGRPSIVGTTIKAPKLLPEHLAADEKHTRLYRDKLFIPTTVAQGVILGASVAESATTDDLEAAYGEFAEEARELAPSYSPESVGADGWDQTRSAWKRLFPRICIILCYLHSVLKIGERCVRDKGLRKKALDKVWWTFYGPDRTCFSQRLRRLREWAQGFLPEGGVREMVLKLCSKGSQFVLAYAHPGCYRTSNPVDRLMDHQDRFLYAMRYLHGKPESARLMVRSMALLWNFHPYSGRLRSEQPWRRSPFHDINGFDYHDKWLHNLQIASSIGGRFTAPHRIR